MALPTYPLQMWLGNFQWKLDGPTDLLTNMAGNFGMGIG